MINLPRSVILIVMVLNMTFLLANPPSDTLIPGPDSQSSDNEITHGPKKTIDEDYSKINKKNGKIESQSTKIYDGLFQINIKNNTSLKVYIFLNDKFSFLLLPKRQGYSNHQVKGFSIKGTSIIYARTANNKLQWGPVEINESMDDFTWNLND